MTQRGLHHFTVTSQVAIMLFNSLTMGIHSLIVLFGIKRAITSKFRRTGEAPIPAPSRTAISPQSVGPTSIATPALSTARTPRGSHARSSDAGTMGKATASLARTNSRTTTRACTKDKWLVARPGEQSGQLQLHITPKHPDRAV